MKTILGVDQSGRVLLVSEGPNASIMPTEFNGAQITAHVLDDAQKAAFDALPTDRSGTTFDGARLTALPPVAQQQAEKQETVADLKAALISRGVLTQSDIDGVDGR
jgi:hypothetical protein